MKETTKQIEVIPSSNLYKWAKNFKRVQDRFFDNQYKIRRLQQIEDFIYLNNFNKVYHEYEVDLELEMSTVESKSDADLILITHQGYSRYPLSGIIEKVSQWLEECPNLYLCLNRHYLNIDNKKVDIDLPDSFLPAITSWLTQSLPNAVVVDISRNYVDRGSHFTWVCPDRHYYIKKI